MAKRVAIPQDNKEWPDYEYRPFPRWIGRDEFDNRFAGPPWSVPDLDGWFLRNDPDRPFDSYAKARAWAFR